LLNWELVEEFHDHFGQIKVQGLAHPLILKDLNREPKAKSYSLKVGPQFYQIHQIKKDHWILQKPKQQWLIYSAGFSILEGKSPQDWLSSMSDELKVLKNSKLSLQERKSALDKIKGRVNKDVRRVMGEILSNKSDSIEIKLALVDALRFTPSSGTMRTIASALPDVTDRELLGKMFDVLLLRNPNGPRLIENQDWQAINDSIRKWQEWAKTLDQSP